MPLLWPPQSGPPAARQLWLLGFTLLFLAGAHLARLGTLPARAAYWGALLAVLVTAVMVAWWSARRWASPGEALRRVLTPLDRRLAASAREIGDVVQLINNIAGKTNLLALNATIEAARAGEAGKGFAVVATEVKNLAMQTAQATEVITRTVAAMQSATEEAVVAIRGIGGAVEDVNETLVAISAAVEEQSAATNEIARNVEQAAAGTSEVTSRMALVTSKATETGEASREVLSAAAELSDQSTRLETEMGVFVEALRKVV
jgi:hypothetical protein